VNELEQRWSDLGEFIREQRRLGHLSLRKLSEMAGISNPYLSQIERGLRKPSAEILQRIARSLEISAETLYVQAGILEARPGDHDVVGEIHRDPDLTEDQKKTLVHIYQSFTAETRAARGDDAVDRADELDPSGNGGGPDSHDDASPAEASGEAARERRSSDNGRNGDGDGDGNGNGDGNGTAAAVAAGAEAGHRGKAGHGEHDADDAPGDEAGSVSEAQG
jgi:transcriptional regulator with XRE-family HTH domain